MSELAVYIPAEIALHPQDLVDEVAIPLLPASKIARGQLHPDRIPPSIARVEDVTRQIEEAIQGLATPDPSDPSQDIEALFEAVEGKADILHSHPDLLIAIDGKAATIHVHPDLVTAIDGKASAIHAHPDLMAAIEGKASAVHTHPDLLTAIEGKAAAVHTHADLTAAINTKAEVNHTHTGLPIVSATAPSSPSVGQRWLDTGDRLTWFWDGTYWLSEQVYSHSVGGYTFQVSSGAYPHPFSPHPSYNLFFLRMYMSAIFLAGTYNASNNSDCRLFRDVNTANPVQETVLSTVLTTQSALLFATFSTALNFHRDLVALQTSFFRIGFNRVGTPPDLQTPSAKFEYRLAKR